MIDIKVRLELNKNFFKRRKSLNKAQEIVDSSCMKHLNEFVPIAPEWYEKSGSLRDSLENPQAGKLIYTSRFSPYTYYDETSRKNRGNPKGTRMWFETMKNHYKDKILVETKKELKK